MKKPFCSEPAHCLFLHLMQIASTTELLPQWTSFTTDVVFEASHHIPGSVQYVIKRFAKPEDWMGDEVGQMRYHYEAAAHEKNYLELRFWPRG